ncbi:class I SAM-dependent methyltransferase [Thermodesulfobacteriota bacterium]
MPNKLIEILNKTKMTLKLLINNRSWSYSPSKFWENRHIKHGLDFKAVANISNNNEAHARYRQQKGQFLTFLESIHIKLMDKNCIEFGCGNGFWGNVVLQKGVRSYLGLDISKTAIQNCIREVPDGIFKCFDLSAEVYQLEDKADLVFSIDVVQHIVEEEKLKLFLKNMTNSVKPGGHIVFTSYTGYGDQYADPEKEKIILRFIKVPKLRWVYAWDIPTLRKHLNNCELIESTEFWDKTILAFKRH